VFGPGFGVGVAVQAVAVAVAAGGVEQELVRDLGLQQEKVEWRFLTGQLRQGPTGTFSLKFLFQNSGKSIEIALNLSRAMKTPASPARNRRKRREAASLPEVETLRKGDLETGSAAKPRDDEPLRQEPARSSYLPALPHQALQAGTWRMAGWLRR